MAKEKKLWKKGRGKLGIFDPLLGNWEAESDSPMGKVKCSRRFEKVLNGEYIKMNVSWQFAKSAYVEEAIIGVKDGVVTFWSFTSDGKNSSGTLADVTDVHPEAIGFEAQMPAGFARMVYWPDEQGGYNWEVASKTKKGWNRFVLHQYSAVK